MGHVPCIRGCAIAAYPRRTGHGLNEVIHEHLGHVDAELRAFRLPSTRAFLGVQDSHRFIVGDGGTSARCCDLPVFFPHGHAIQEPDPNAPTLVEVRAGDGANAGDQGKDLVVGDELLFGKAVAFLTLDFVFAKPGLQWAATDQLDEQEDKKEGRLHG